MSLTIKAFSTETIILKCDKDFSNGRWAKEEHQRFVDAIKLHGKNWKKVEECIGTRTGAQIRSHAQKYFLKLEKEHKTFQKGRSDKEQSKFTKKFSEASTSESETLSISGKCMDDLKKNLPLTEIDENLTERSQNAIIIPENHLIATEKSISDDSSVASKSNEMQTDNESYSKLSKSQLLSRLKACEEKVEEYHKLVKNFTKTTLTTETTPYQILALGNSYHHFVYLDLMSYFSNFNKNAQSLKISDFVDLKHKTSANGENSFSEPTGKKRIKKL